MPGLERDLMEASQLTVETLYESAPGPLEATILGKGEAGWELLFSHYNLR